MKNIVFRISLFFATIFLISSCSKDDSPVVDPPVRATSEDFVALRITSLNSKAEEFQFNAGQTGFLTSKNGVIYTINGSCLSKEGNAITGMVDVQIVELFDKGAMLTTDKATMGVLPNGDKGVLQSGGEFFLNITQDGEPVDNDCDMIATIPSDLTGGAVTGMTLWKGEGIDPDCIRTCIDDDCDGIVWNEIKDINGTPVEATTQAGDQGERYYVAPFGDFGWTNVDRFRSDTRPKTSILVDVPDGFDDENSRVYLAYVGEPNALAYLDTYDATAGVFSEHYGQIPIGLECHLIFTSELDGEWLYAIKSITVTDGGTVEILDADLSTASEAQLEMTINNLP